MWGLPASDALLLRLPPSRLLRRAQTQRIRATPDGWPRRPRGQPSERAEQLCRKPHSSSWSDPAGVQPPIEFASLRAFHWVLSGRVTGDTKASAKLLARNIVEIPGLNQDACARHTTGESHIPRNWTRQKSRPV